MNDKYVTVTQLTKYIKYIEGLELINQKKYNQSKEIFEQLSNFYNSNYYLNYIEALKKLILELGGKIYVNT